MRQQLPLTVTVSVPDAVGTLARHEAALRTAGRKWGQDVFLVRSDGALVRLDAVATTDGVGTADEGDQKSLQAFGTARELVEKVPKWVRKLGHNVHRSDSPCPETFDPIPKNTVVQFDTVEKAEGSLLQTFGGSAFEGELHVHRATESVKGKSRADPNVKRGVYLQRR